MIYAPKRKTEKRTGSDKYKGAALRVRVVVEGI
jgi:hypothetical protein